MFDPMAELTGAPSHDLGDDDSAPAEQKSRPPRQGGGGNRRFSDDLHSISIRGRQRTFYIDLKQSANGKFFKVSEKSRGGQKTTIMFDAEELQQFIDAFTEMKSHI